MLPEQSLAEQLRKRARPTVEMSASAISCLAVDYDDFPQKFLPA
jgi:hypothetical protein